VCPDIEERRTFARGGSVANYTTRGKTTFPGRPRPPLHVVAADTIGRDVGNDNEQFLQLIKRASPAST